VWGAEPVGADRSVRSEAGRVGVRLRCKRRGGLLLGLVSESRREARPDDEHHQDRPDCDDRREGDHGFMLVRLVMFSDCERRHARDC
jgi:hypothetical protein